MRITNKHTFMKNFIVHKAKTGLLFLFFGLLAHSGWGQTNPTAFALSGGNFTFTGFGVGTTTTYPSNMQGHKFAAEPATANITNNASADFALSTSTSAIGTGSFRNEVANGISILNSGSNNLGAVVVALDASGRSNLLVTFTAQQLNDATTRVNGLRLQYRLGTTGSFTDVSPTQEYLTTLSGTNTASTFSNIALPSACDNQSIVHVRWIYYSSSGSGGRDRIRLDEITISSSVGSSTSSNIILNTGFTHPTNIDYTAYQAASGLTTGNSIEVGKFDIQDGGGSSDADALSTTLTACSFSIANSSNIRALALFDGATNLGEITTVSATSAFTGLTLEAADNGSKTFSIRATFKSTVTDNQQISFAVASATASGSGSGFAAANAGAAATTTTGDNNRIEVATTDIIFDQNVSTVAQNAVMNPSPTVRAIDGNANYDLDNTSNVVLTIGSGSTTFDASATTTATMAAGVATFSNLIFSTAANTNTLTATQGATSDASSSFNVTASAPEINVKQNVTSLASGSGSHAAGSIVSGNSGSAITFTIENLGSANLTYSSILNSNTTDFILNTTSTSSPIAASGSTTFTVTFNPTTPEAKSTTITINNNDADEGTYTFTVTGTGTVSAASDIITNGGYLYSSNIDYSSFQTANTLTTGNSVGVAGLTIRDGGAASDSDNLGTTLTAISFTTGGSSAIRTAALFDGSTNVSEVAVGGATTFSFSGLTLGAADASTKNFELRVTYQTTVTDNQQITYTVSAATASATNSGFASANAGAAASIATGDINRLEVTASTLAFVQQVSNVSVNTAMTSAPTVSANDPNGNRDLDYVTDMISTSTGTFAAGSTNTVTPAAGLGTFTNLQFSAAGNAITISVGSGTLTATGNSSSFNVYDAQPTVQASVINFTNVGMNSMTINWTNGDGANRIVVVKAAGAPGTPTDGVSYTANTIMGSGSTFGASEFVVYNGTGNTVDITNLLGSTTYSVKVFEYNGSAGTENYLTTSNNTSQTTTSLSYYSNGSGDPAVLANWKTARNGTGSSPSNFTSGETFIIESGDSMTTTTTWSISGTSSKLQIENGGTLTANNAITLATATTFQIDNGGTYIHANTGTPSSTIFIGTESFGASSNVRIDNWINNTTAITTGVTLPYGNLEINYSSNTSNWQNSLSGIINLCAGNLTITSVGTGSFRFTASSAPTLTIAGNYTQTAGIVNLASTSAGSSVTTLNVGGNFAVNGGTFTSSSTGSKVVFNKTGSQSFTNAGTISVVNFEVGASSILDLGTSVLSGGSFTIPSGATLKTAHASGISGAITATTKSFSSAANYEFNGAATGTFTTTPTANTVNNLTINRSAGVTLSQNLAVAGALTQTAGKLSIGGFTLTLNGTYSGDATNSLTGSATSNLTLGASLGTVYFDQTTPGTTNVLKNLTLSSGSATLGNALNITAGLLHGILSVGASATLTTGGNLTLKSDTNGTARVSEVGTGGAITGNVTVERYIPAKRAWRALTAPLKGSNTSLYASWQNGGTAVSPYNTGIELWGPSGTGMATGPAYNIRQYTTSGWADVTNSQSVNLFTTTANNAYMVFITGGYGSNNIGNGQSAATTLKATGQLITGTASFAVTSARHTLVGNPFASPLSPAAIMAGNTQANLYTNIWLWDPAVSTNGVYVNYDASVNSGTFSDNSGSYTTSSTAIQSGQAFFVKAVAGTDTLTLTESMKSSSISNTFRNSNNITASVVRLGFAKQIGTDWMPLDGAIAALYNNANASVDVADGTKMVNTSENIAFVRGTTNLSIEHYPIVNATDQLNVKIWNTQQAHYKLKLNTEEFTMAGVEAYLQDLYTGTSQPLNLDGSVQEYEFDVDPTVSASSGTRFRIVFTNTALAVDTPTQGQLSIYPNPATGGKVTVSLPTGNFEGCSYELINVLGQVVRQDEINNSTSSQVSIPITGLPNSWYALRIRKDNSVLFQGKLIIKN